MKKAILFLIGFAILFTPMANTSAKANPEQTPPGKKFFWIPPVVPSSPVTVATSETPNTPSIPEATETPVADTSVNGIPGLDTFSAEVRGLGILGIWAEGLFAYKALGLGWGNVPNEMDTASYGTYESYGAYFIHSNLGGDKLYFAKPGIRIAVIRPNTIDWFIVNNTVAFMGTPNGVACGYQEPYVSWGQDLATGTHFSTIDIIETYYSMPFAIQTCYCANGQGGVFILTGVWDN